MGNYGSVNVPGVSGPELEAVRAIANSALEKANEALEGGGGSECVLKITFDADFAGQQYTVTDGAGDTKTGTVPEGLVDSVSVKNCNTEYTVSASTASGEQYSATVTTGAYFGQYEVTLAVFTAIITVTTAPGAEAKAVLGGSTYTATANGSGVAAISVKKAGKYTVSATISGKTSASVFCYLIYRKVSKYLIERYEAGKKKDEQLKTTLDQVSKYPEYRAQSLRVQKELQTEIDALHSAQSEQIERLKKMEDDMTRRERNRLRDRLLQSYRYYTDPACNPAGTWNTMEAEAFWEMFSDYEDVGGNGYIHSVVQPAMNKLKIVNIDEPIPGRTRPGSGGDKVQ